MSRVDGEMVLLDTSTGKYFGLNSVAALVWDLLETPRNVEELAQAVCRQYAVTLDDCGRDIEALLHDLREQELVVESALHDSG